MLRFNLLIRIFFINGLWGLGFAHAFVITPPPGEYTDTYAQRGIAGGTWKLDADYIGGITFNPSAEANIDLQGHTLTVDAGGIQLHNPSWSRITGNGAITSNQAFIDIVVHARTIDGGSIKGLVINTVISDSTRKVGLRITGKRADPYAGVVYLRGNKNNTFTGDVIVSGDSNYLALGKTGGATAVRGNIFVSDRAVLRFDENQQVLYSTRITLNKGTLYLSDAATDRTTKFRSLIIEGESVLSFGSIETHTHKRFIYLDELVIQDGGTLDVVSWAPGRDFFLVKKTMDKQALDESLSKIHFKGWLPGRTHLESYDKEYWAIMGTPEPETCGAILGAVGLGLVVWRKRRRRGGRIGSFTPVGGGKAKRRGGA